MLSAGKDNLLSLDRKEPKQKYVQKLRFPKDLYADVRIEESYSLWLTRSRSML